MIAGRGTQELLQCAIADPPSRMELGELLQKLRARVGRPKFSFGMQAAMCL